VALRLQDGPAGRCLYYIKCLRNISDPKIPRDYQPSGVGSNGVNSNRQAMANARFIILHFANLANDMHSSTTNRRADSNACRMSAFDMPARIGVGPERCTVDGIQESRCRSHNLVFR
jgi:hypothetical protein